MLNVSLTTIRRLVRSRSLPYVKIGKGIYRFDRAQIISIIKPR